MGGGFTHICKEKIPSKDGRIDELLLKVLVMGGASPWMHTTAHHDAARPALLERVRNLLTRESELFDFTEKSVWPIVVTVSKSMICT
jgi:hypothetical protein